MSYFDIFLFIYIKMSKNLSAKCYQENKKRLQKKSRPRYQNLFKKRKKKKKKSDNMVVNVAKILK